MKLLPLSTHRRRKSLYPLEASSYAVVVLAAVVRGGELEWVPHRLNQKILTKPLLTKEKHEVEATVIYVYVPAGEGVPEHVHLSLIHI